jgi:hypothetical protein
VVERDGAGGAVGAGEPSDRDEGAGVRVHVYLGRGTALPPSRYLRATRRDPRVGGGPWAGRSTNLGGGIARADPRRQERQKGSGGGGRGAGLARIRGGVFRPLVRLLVGFCLFLVGGRCCCAGELLVVAAMLQINE